MDAFIRHLELENTSSTLYVPFLINENLLPVPAIILLSIAGRGFIFWCLNVIFIHVILSKGKQLLWGPRRSGSPLATSSFGFEHSSHNGTNVLEVRTNSDFHFSFNRNLINALLFGFQSHFTQSKEQSRYSDPVRHQEELKTKYQYDNMNFQQDNYDLNRDIGRRYLEPIKSEPMDDAKRKLTSRIHVNADTSSINSWNTTKVIPKGNFNRQKSSSPKIANALSNPWREIDDGAALKIERPHFRLPNKPSLLKKLSDASYSTAAADDHQLHSPTATNSTDELRGQRPWSYFHGRDQSLPKKIYSQHGHDRD